MIKRTALKGKLKEVCNKKNKLLFACVLLVLIAAIVLAWACTLYFGKINTRFYTVTALGDEWKLRMKEDSRVYYNLSDGFMEPLVMAAQDFTELREQFISGHLDSLNDPDLLGELSMPNLTAINIKAPKGYRDQQAWATTYYPHGHITDYNREILVSTNLVKSGSPYVEFRLMTESAFWKVAEAGYTNYTKDRGENFHIISREKISDRNADLTKYSDGEWQGAFLQYTLSDVDTTLYVTEEYKINFAKRTATSKWVIYGIDGGYYFECGSIMTHDDVPENWNPERPEVEFLMQFGVQRVIPTAVVIVSGVIVVAALIGGIVILRKKPHILRNALRRKKYDGEAFGNNDCEQFSQKP